MKGLRITHAQAHCVHNWKIEHPKNGPIHWVCTECGQQMDFFVDVQDAAESTANESYCDIDEDFCLCSLVQV